MKSFMIRDDFSQGINPLIEYPNPIEQWVDLQCYNIRTGYKISNYGRFLNIEGNLLSVALSNGYLSVSLQLNDSTRKSFFVHILVATMYVFNPDPINKTQVNHKNLCRSDAFYGNLEWCTQLENLEHEFQNKDTDREFSKHVESRFVKEDGGWGTGENTYGENNGMSKWTEEQVHSICKYVQDGDSYGNALIKSNMENNRFNVSHIIKGKRWKHISTLYKFKEKKPQIDFFPYVENICKLLSKGYSTRAIIDELKLPGEFQQQRSIIGRIKRKESHTEISNKYNFNIE